MMRYSPGTLGAAASGTFRAEDYRSYLGVLARVHLARAGPVRRKLDASDVVQDALLHAHEARAQFRGTTDSEFAAWLRRILTNTLVDAARRFGRQKRDVALEESCRSTVEGSASRLLELQARDQTSPTGHVARRERELLLSEALQSLPEDQRTAVELRYLGDCQLEEIATLMHRTKPSVAGLLRRGLEDLRARLDALA